MSGFTADVAERVERELLELKKNKFWAIYVFPNGSIELASEPEDKSDSFEEKSLFFKKMEQMIGGKALFSRE